MQHRYEELIEMIGTDSAAVVEMFVAWETEPSKVMPSAKQKTGGGCSGASCSADFDGWKERLAAYRKEHFAVTTAAPREDCDTVTLFITTNGNQWQTIGLMPDEIQRVIDALVPFLPNSGEISPPSAHILR